MRFKTIDDVLYLDEEEIGFIEVHDDVSEYFFNCENVVDDIDTKWLHKYYSLIENDFIDNYAFHFINENFIKIGKINNTVNISITYSCELSEWENNISVKKFSKIFSETSIDSYVFNSSIDSGVMYLDISTKLNKNETIIESIKKIDEIYLKKYDEILLGSDIITFINFSPEHLIAGTSILQYFSKLLNEKYKDEKVSVSIKQEGLKVVLSIETPDGKKEEIEEYLNKFGMVITNKIKPEEFTTNKIELIELKNELREAENKIEFQKEILALKDETYKNNIVTLEQEVKWLRDEFSTVITSGNQKVEILLKSLLSKDKLINKLTKAINNKDIEQTKTILNEIKDKDTKGYKNLSEHINSLLISSVSNLPTWVEFIRIHFR